MKLCPSCKQWTLEFDDYFGRFRCLNSECGWAQSSTAELALNRLEKRTEPSFFPVVKCHSTGKVLRPWYDSTNDAFVVDFGQQGEASFDLPEDARWIWQLSASNGAIMGVVILGAMRWGLGEKTNLDATMRIIEEMIKSHPDSLCARRASHMFVSRIAEGPGRQPGSSQDRTSRSQMGEALNKAIRQFHKLVCSQNRHTGGQPDRAETTDSITIE